MTRSGLVAGSHQRPLSWVIVGASLVAYLGLLVAVGMTGLLLDVPLPWWAAQAAPPLLYALLVLVFVRPGSATSVCGGALLLWAVHLLLGMFTQPVLALLDSPGTTGAAWSFPPAPLPEILWVPVLLVPLRDLLRGAPPARAAHPQAAAARRPVPDQRTVPSPAPTSGPGSRTSAARPVEAAAVPGKPAFEKPAIAPTRASGATTVTSMEPRLEAARRPAMAAPAAAHQAAQDVDGKGPQPPAPVVAHATPEPVEVAPTQAQRLTDTLLARDTSDEPLRVSLARVLAQLPAEALAVPVERLNWDAGGHLSVPRRMVLTQLSGGAVCAPWNLLAPQVPAHLLAVSHEAIASGLPDGNCALPLDEIVRQLSPDMFLPVGPGPDFRGIEAFPAPFQPLGTNRTEPTAEIEVLPAPIMAASVDPEPPDMLAATMPAIDDESGSVDTLDDEVADAADVSSDSQKRVDHVSMLSAPDDEEEYAGPSTERAADIWPDAVEASLSIAEPDESDAEPARAASERQDDLHLLRELTALLPAVGPLAIEVRMVDGVPLFAATSPAVDVEAVRIVTAHLLPLLKSGRRAWPVDQVTLRDARAALVITPLGSLLAGAPVLAVSVPSGGGLALIELRCRQAAAAHSARVGAPLDDDGALGEEREEPDLLDVEPSTRTREVAASLGALGTVTASSLRDADADHTLYLFLPPGSDVRALGALAHDVSGAMRQAAEAGVTYRTAVLRSAARRMVIRLPAGRSDTFVAAGETAKPGLAYRQVEHAAAALGAL